jgi:hypothetical protein
MFCPECKAEYRFGFTRCSDCDVDLVEQLPEIDRGSGDELTDATMKEVWSGHTQGACVSLCLELRDAEIPYKVIQPSRQSSSEANQQYRVGVPPEFYDRARELAAPFDAPTQEDKENRGEINFIAPDAEDSGETGDYVSNESRSEWDPERATVEVWCGPAEDEDGMIGMSLRENGISYCAEPAESGKNKLFVVPEDEAQAREIIRQINDAGKAMN